MTIYKMRYRVTNIDNKLARTCSSVKFEEIIFIHQEIVINDKRS